MRKGKSDGVRKNCLNVENRLAYEATLEKACEGIIITGKIPVDYNTIHKAIQQVGIEIFGVSERKPKVKEDKHLSFLLRKLRRARKNWRYAKRKGIDTLKDNYACNIAKTKMEIREHQDKTKVFILENLIKSFYTERGPGLQRLFRFVAQSKKSNIEQFLLKEEGGDIIKKRTQVALKLEEFVNSVFQLQIWPEHYLTQMPPSLRLDENAKAMLGEEITIQELLEACQGLNLGTSVGTTGIPPECMRFVGESMRTILVDMFNNIIKKEEISEESFTSNITFLHKKGKTDDIRNYRTIGYRL